MNNRHRAREVALQILYRYDLGQQQAQPQSPLTESPAIAPLASSASNSVELLKELTRHFDHFQVPPNLREFAAQLVSGTLQKMPELDATLEKHTSNWKINRLGFVDRNLLRMSAYELKYMKETPAPVVIDEAVELAKQFGTEDTPSFVNGVLDAIMSAAAAQT